MAIPRWTERELAAWRLVLEMRDGKACQDCGKYPEEMERPVLWNEIDHINEKKYDDRPENLQFLCKPHNTAKSNRLRPRRGKHAESTAEEQGHTGADLAGTGDDSTISLSLSPAEIRAQQRDVISFQDGKPEMRAKGIYSDLFARWVWKALAQQGGFMVKKEAIPAGAFVTGASKRTIEDYFDVACSFEGPLRYANNEAGVLGIEARHYDPPATNGTKPPEGQIHGDATATADDVSDDDHGHPSLS